MQKLENSAGNTFTLLPPYEWQDKLFYELFLMFGLRSAPYIFNLFSEALHWILQHHLPAWIRHYLDDFLLIFKPSTPTHIVRAAMLWFRGLVSFLGLNIQDAKTEGPSTKLEMLGIELDSIAMEARLPPSKVKFLHETLQEWTAKSHCTLRELQELTGYLHFCSAVIPHSRAFIRALEDFSSSFTSPFATRRITRIAKRDLLWWSTFSHSWNGIHLITPSRPTVHIYTDASGTKGIGGVFHSSWFSIPTPHRYKSRDIKFKELYAVIYAILCWGPQLARHHVVFHIDNTNAFSAIANLSIRSAPTMELLRQFLALAARLDFTFTPIWIASDDNFLADAASRFQYARLFNLGPHISKMASVKSLSLHPSVIVAASTKRPTL